MNPKRPTPRHIIIKMPTFKDKERFLKAAMEKQEVTYKWALTRLAADFSTKTLQARREWQEIFQVMKSKDLQPRILCPVRLSIKMEDEISSFANKTEMRIHLHQTGTTRYAKGTAIRGRIRMRERGTQVQMEKNDWVPIKNNLKCQWIKCSNQKTQSSWKDKNYSPLEVLFFIL